MMVQLTFFIVVVKVFSILLFRFSKIFQFLLLQNLRRPLTFLWQCWRGMMVLLPLLHSPLFPTIPPDFPSCANGRAIDRDLRTFQSTFTFFFTFTEHFCTGSFSNSSPRSPYFWWPNLAKLTWI